jgi:hypothetical protein
MDPFIIGISPDEITGRLVDVIANALRKPSNLHIVEGTEERTE